MDRLILIIAQGLGTGRSSVAPGTVGTLLGLPLFILLLLPGSFAFYVGALLLLLVACFLLHLWSDRGPAAWSACMQWGKVPVRCWLHIRYSLYLVRRCVCLVTCRLVYM